MFFLRILQIFVCLHYKKKIIISFNKLFLSGTFPSQLCESVIQPIHKKGDVNCPDSYRGISLLNISGKLYSYVLNKRFIYVRGLKIII